jgi:predicted Zn-dependent protease with MMP-like domain
MRRMSMTEFRELVRQVMETLPPSIAQHLNNIVVDVADEPSPEFLHRRTQFTEEEIDEGHTLFGLFEPMPHLSYEGLELDERPNRLWIFKNPHEEEFPDPGRLKVEIRKTVIHELAHHFGWTDRDLERFDATPDPFGDN